MCSLGMAHFYGTTGSNIATESGCSSSMVAVGLACKSLRRRDTSMAIACGVNLLLQPTKYKVMAAFCAEDGHSKTFDAAANGFGRAEGCGVLVLKRLSDAVRDGDNIRAVIRGYGEAQEGPSKSLGTPTVEVEKLAMSLALKDAEVLPAEVSFVEAHGTGTAVGDPMEMEAIAQVYSHGRTLPLVVTSVKTNVGHTESVSGIVGLIKTVLALENEVLPPHRALNELNPKIALSKIPAVIPLEPVPWPVRSNAKRIAGVSSFGITGTDTHVIVEEAPQLVRLHETSTQLPLDILALSARSEDALVEMLEKYATTVKEMNAITWSDVAFTANTRRAHFKDFRTAIVAKSVPDFLRQVKRNTVKIVKCPSSSEKNCIVFLFTGQGSQHPGMAKELYALSTDFRRLFDKCDKVLRDCYDIDIKRALWGSNEIDLLHQTLYSQTSIFVVDFCLAELWKSWGVHPDVVVGHSLGEYAAATVAGILTLEDALKLVAGRSRLIDNLPHGKMIVVNVDYEATCKLRAGCGISDLDVAAMNSPEQTTLAGTEEDILTFKKFCEDDGVKSKILEATHAFHSKMMDPALPQLRKLAETINYGTATSCTFISGMEGREVTSIDAEYWVRHTREPVNFVKASKEIEKGSNIIAVEVGPQPVLSSFVGRNLEGTSTSALLLPSLRRGKSDWETLLESIGKAYTAGVDVNWRGFHRTSESLKVTGLPTYPFQRKKFWFTKPKANDPKIQLHPLVQFRFHSATPTRVFESLLSVKRLPYIKDHVVGTHVIFPAAGYLEMILSAGHCATLAEFEDFRYPRQPIFLSDLLVDAPMKMTSEEDDNVQLQTIVNPLDDSNWNAVSIHRRAEDAAGTKSWIRHCNAKFCSFSSDSIALEIPETIDVVKLAESLAIGEMGLFYDKCREVGLNFGETFRSVKRFWKGEESALAEVACPEEEECYFVHPVAIDAMIQTLMAAQHEQISQLMVPVKIDHFAWFGLSQDTPSTSLYVYVKKNELIAVLLDRNGRKVAVMRGVTLVPTTVASIETALQSQNLVLPTLFEEEWIPVPHLSQGQISNYVSICPVEFFKSPPGLRILEIERKQVPVTDEEKYEISLANEFILLHFLQAFLEMGWNPHVNNIVDVRRFTSEYKIPEKNLLTTRRYFEIISHQSSFLEKLDSWTFRVSAEIPSIPQIELRIAGLIKLIHVMTVEVECVRSVASSISKVLGGRGTVLPILFGEDRIAEKSYTDILASKYFSKILGQVVQTICEHVHKCQGSTERRTLRFLEIGGGTGGSTRIILPVLKESGMEFSYTFTDISASFFSGAETAFGECADRMEFKVLNIENDPKTQGFIPEYFDVIVAAHVLHATRDMTETMRNVRHLLKPNGLVLIGELFKPSPFVDAIFGLVDGYWRFEDYEQRPLHCILPEETWHSLLTSVGFTPGFNMLEIPTKNAGLIVAQASCGTFDYSVPQMLIKNTWIVVRGLTDDLAFKEVTLKFITQGRQVIGVEDVNESKNKWKIALEAGVVEGIMFLEDGWRSDTQEHTRRFLVMIQTLVSVRMNLAPRIVVVTRGALSVGDQGRAYPHGATLWGMSRTLRSEHATFSVVNIDLDPHAASDVNVACLFHFLWSGNKSDFIALRNGKTLTAKLKRWKVKSTSLKLPQNADRFGLILPKTNAVVDLQYGASPALEVKENYVEIQLKAVALNFKDLLCVLKPTKEFEKNAAVGTDMAGIVTSLGPQVTHLKVGDRVFGAFFQFGGLPSHIAVPEESVIRIPHYMTFADASTLPAVFTTAYYCLVDLAKLREGETVLIHTASGGVGLAAIQIARAVGAKIIATAGNRRKRAYLREVVGLGNVFHSRDVSYTDEIRKVTGGRGVDVVLNSLTSPGFKEASLEVCSQNGRFVEMSKLNIWSESEVKELRPDVEYQIVDLTTVSVDTWRHLLRTLEAFLDQQKLHPLPYESFECVDIREALTHLQKARHIGKIVCKMPEAVERRHFLFNERSTYLITGGLGGIGLEAAKWMASEGAKFIVLCGRRPPNDKAKQVMSELNSNGKVVKSVSVDVGKFEDCKALIDSINERKLVLDGQVFPPLRGVQHAAGCLSDATFSNQKWEKYEETFNGKVKGAWNLHEVTMKSQVPLEHFVMYSSLAATFGAIGQSNHAASNAFLDSLAHYRNARGLPATSVNWGQWGQVGVAADLKLSFFTPFTPLQGFTSLKEILRHHKIQVGVIETDFAKLKLGFPWIDCAGYASSFVTSPSRADKRSALAITPEKFWDQVEGAKGDSKETELVLQHYLKEVVRHILRLEEGESIDVDGSLQEMGLDSLMMVELKNAIQAVLGSRVTLNANDLADANSIKKLAVRLREKILEGEKFYPEENVNLLIGLSALPEDIKTTEESSIQNLLDGEKVSVLVSGVDDSLFCFFVLESLTTLDNVKKVTVLSSTFSSETFASKVQETGANIDVRKCPLIAQDEDHLAELGIPHSDYDKLASEVDVVVDIRLKISSQNESASAIKKETEMTRKFLEFATTKKLKFLVHVNRLLPQRKGTSQNVLEETLPRGTKEDLEVFLERGYPSSQFVSESLLREANNGRGVPCVVFRVPHLSGDSRTGRFQLDEGHIFYRLLHFLSVGKIPTVPIPFALVPVDQAASLLIQVLWKFGSLSKDEQSLCCVFNLSNPHEYSIGDFVRVSEELGRPVRAVELEEFMEGNNQNSAVQTITYMFGDPLDYCKENSNYSKLMESTLDGLISCGNLKKVIDSSETRVETPLQILQRDIRFAVDSGILDKLLPSNSDN